MDKIKKIISPGSKTDDETMYETGNSGKLSGQGSHFGKGPEASGTREAESHVNVALPGESGGSGQAAIGETSTYSSHALPTGDKTSSVVDPSSSDPTTFRRPEAASNAGVGPGAAEAAAKTAYEGDHHIPGEFPSEDSSNPYATSTIDPRVDSAGHAPVRQSNTGRDTALGVGAGAAGIGAYEATKGHDSTAPTTLTSVTNPTERSAAYGAASESKGLDSATPATTSTAAATSPPAAEESTPKKGMVGAVLGALGLGGGAAAVASHEHDHDSAIDSTRSTTTGVSSHRSPSQSGPPPSHHRKESIPTTAYPAGNLESVRPIAGPTGQAPIQETPETHTSRNVAAGTSTAAPQGSTVHDVVTGDTPRTSEPAIEDSRQYGRDAAIGGGAVGAAAGAAAIGAHEHEKARAPATATSGVTPTSQQYGNQPITSEGSRGFSDTVDPRTDVDGNARAGTGVGAVPTLATKAEDDHHYGRDAAIGGGAIGAAAIGAHEYEKNKQPAADTSGITSTSGVTPTSQQYGNQPITTEGTKGVTTEPAPPYKAEDDHHYGRDAAVVGGGAAATGYAAHEISEHDAVEEEKQRAKLQKQQTKDAEKLEKEQEKQQEKEAKKERKAEEKAEKKHEKEIAKEEKKQEKAAAKEEKKQEKELAKEEKQHEKELAEQQKLREKELAEQQKLQEKEQKRLQDEALAEQEIQRERELANQRKLENESLEEQEARRHEGTAAAVGAGTLGAGALGAGAYEAEKHHQASSGTTGFAATDPTGPASGTGVGSTAHQQSLTGGAGTAAGGDPYYTRQPVPDSAVAGQHTDSAIPAEHHAGHGDTLGAAGGAAATGHGTSTATDPYYARQPVPDSAIADQQAADSAIPTAAEHHTGRDAAIGGAGVAAVGGAAYGAEKHHHNDQPTSDSLGRHTSAGGSSSHEKKPSLFRRIFKRKKNVHTGESEDDEDNYEDVPHDGGPSTHHHGQTSSSSSPVAAQHPHVEGELTKPSYNPFKKEDPGVNRAVEGRL